MAIQAGTKVCWQHGEVTFHDGTKFGVMHGYRYGRVAERYGHDLLIISEGFGVVKKTIDEVMIVNETPVPTEEELIEEYSID